MDEGEVLAGRVRAYIAGLHDARKMTAASQRHTDAMLTWAIGLMGGGIVSLFSVLAHWRAVTRPDTLLAVSPWILGILLALLGRLVVKELMSADDQFVFLKQHALNELLLATGGVDVTRFRQIASNEVCGLKGARDKMETFGRWTDRLYYVTHGLFGLGVIAFYWAATFA